MQDLGNCGGGGDTRQFHYNGRTNNRRLGRVDIRTRMGEIKKNTRYKRVPDSTNG